MGTVRALSRLKDKTLGFQNGSTRKDAAGNTKNRDTLGEAGTSRSKLLKGGCRPCVGFHQTAWPAFSLAALNAEGKGFGQTAAGFRTQGRYRPRFVKPFVFIELSGQLSIKIDPTHRWTGGYPRCGRSVPGSIWNASTALPGFAPRIPVPASRRHRPGAQT